MFASFFLGGLVAGLGFFISLYLLVRINYFPTTKVAGFIKFGVVVVLCAVQGGCNFIFANFIERDTSLEGYTFQVLFVLSVLALAGFVKVSTKPDAKIEKWPARLLLTLLGGFILLNAIYVFIVYFFD